ncbi:MAG TPA: hypothetical protein VIH05_04935 [Tepidiformaceae bacterium]
MKTKITVRAVAVIAGAIALWGTMLPGGASAEVPADQVPADLRAAIQAEVESRGETFAGMCREIVQHEHYGEWCAFVQEMDEDSAEVTFGPVASDEIYTQSFMKVDGEWTSGQSEEPQDSAISAELRAAIKAFIEAQGKVYAGLCDEVQQTAQPGQYCAMAEVSGNTATVYYGPFASDEISTATFTLVDGEWTVDGEQEQPQEGEVSAELRAAIKAFLEAQGKVYAGLCDEVQQTAQPGQYCASVTISGNTATVTYGPFASDQLSTTTFTLQNGVWKAASSATPTTVANPTPKPPSTGNGSEVSDGMSNAWAAAGLATIGVAVAGLGGALAMRRKDGGR